MNEISNTLLFFKEGYKFVHSINETNDNNFFSPEQARSKQAS